MESGGSEISQFRCVCVCVCVCVVLGGRRRVKNIKLVPLSPVVAIRISKLKDKSKQRSGVKVMVF